MLPIKDTIRSRSFPLVTWVIIAINAVVFFLQMGLSQSQQEWVLQTFALVPGHIQLTNPSTWLPLLTHMFLHGGWLHILSNMWILFIFGDNVEDRMGSLRYLVFYLLGGIAAGLIQAITMSNSTVPVLGASGAIAAVMGAYFFYYPRARVITITPIFFIPWYVEIPAVIYLGLWFVSQFYSGLFSIFISNITVGGVAWWAHIGGFLFGLVMARPFCFRKPPPSWHTDEYYPW